MHFVRFSISTSWHQFLKASFMNSYFQNRNIAFLVVITGVIMQSCSTSGPGLFAKKSPHEQYADKIRSAGLNQTALGVLWFQAADGAINRPLTIDLPYRETGYFPAEKPQAVGLKFTAKRGQKLNISLQQKPANGFLVYLELWQAGESQGDKNKLLLSSDTSGAPLEYEVGRQEQFILRLQPELLKGGEYTINISTGPSLAFPVPSKAKPKVQSFWGAGRDNGARRHEGIDIFAPFRTPVVAAENGTVTRVEETNIGGKVLWLRPEDRSFTLYYAHLDSQIATAGQRVRIGDTVGLMGNTGNAKTTSPHLHFGIYAVGGAVDPFPFVNPVSDEPPEIKVPLSTIGKYSRTDNRIKLYPEPDSKSATGLQLDPQTLVAITAATRNWYKVTLPNGEAGFLPGNVITSINNPLKKLTLKSATGLLDQPDSTAARKKLLTPGNTVNVLASFKDFYYVDAANVEGWIEKKLL
jgi:murein DD-endopeptidase MepM/ murein hydrolase activator NlpD